MRVAIIGGTRFIGRAIAADLAARRHAIVVVHRGLHEPRDAPQCEHVHCDRRDGGALAGALAGIDPDVVVDTCAFDRIDAELASAAMAPKTRVIALSSQDVYRAFTTLASRAPATDALPLDESSPLRTERHPHRGHAPRADRDYDPETYEKLDVERVYLARGATVLRLPMVYGEHDPTRREEPILRRVRAGRKRIPIGAATLLWTRAYVADVARAVTLAAERGVTSEVLNVGEARTWSVGQWMSEILAAAASDAEIVTVPDACLPEDLELTAAFSQHWLVDASRVRHVLGWTETDPREALRRSVRWHLAHPPDDASADFTADDRALASLSDASPRR